jgi:alkylhydroperoxidase/carboxymuconolactone decarboxylase family protein YurZ
MPAAGGCGTPIAVAQGPHRRAGSDRHRRGGVSDVLGWYIQFVQHAEQEIRHWRVLRKRKVAIALQAAPGIAGQDDGQRVEVVFVGIAHTAAIEHHGVVQHIVFAVRRLLQLGGVLEERHTRGIQDFPGREPGHATPVGDELLAVGKLNQTRISGAPVEGAVFEFAPIINQYLQARLFGDIFERDNLDWQSRELATVGALAATPGVEAQLRSHMAASMRVGLTAAQLQELVHLLAEHGDADAASRARAALDSQPK